MPERWTPDSWRRKPIVQVPDYPDKAALAAVEQRLATFRRSFLPVRRATSRKSLGRVAAGDGFLLQGGDCAESFEEHQDQRQQHPRLLPRVPADGGGAHLRGGFAGGEGRAHRRPVRQAALVADARSATARSCRATAATSSTAPSSRPRRARPTRGARSRPIASRPRRSTCCAPSRTAATRASAACTNGCSVSSRTRRSRTTTRNSPTASPRRSTSCAPAGSIPKAIRSCAAPISTPATRRCCSATSRR